MLPDSKNCNIDTATILELFCYKVFETTHNHDSTSLWRDRETQEYYLVAWTYDGEDYYQTAYQYLTKIDMELL